MAGVFGAERGERQTQNALGQEQRHQHEQAAEREQPIFGEGAGEIGLGEVDDDRAERRADQRAASADRHPDHRLDRIGGVEFAGVDDADLRHVERARDARHDGGDDEHEQLIVFDAIAEEAHAALRVADRDDRLAVFGARRSPWRRT